MDLPFPSGLSWFTSWGVHENQGIAIDFDATWAMSLVPGQRIEHFLFLSDAVRCSKRALVHEEFWKKGGHLVICC